MKKRYVPIITFTVAILLVGSIAFAADKRKKDKLAVNELNEICEDETLQVELLATVEDQHMESPATKAASPEKTDDDTIAALANLAIMK
jgi:hypothetical protein